MRWLRHAAVAVAVTVACARAARCATASDEQTLINAEARAAGNRMREAVALGTALLARRWPAQVLKVRVDGAGSHEVAGLVLSGVKFHTPIDADAFTNEVVALVQRAFAHSTVEEVDVWATVPLKVGEHAIVAGDNAVPTTRVVYGATIRREESATFAERLRAGCGVFWNADWKRSLTAHRNASSQTG